MPGEKRHVAALLGEQEGLGANWKSAQCVTSLYDSYIQLQRENEALKEEKTRLQHESELLASQSKLQEPENHTRCQELEQEIKLLRSEKLRGEEAHRLELQKLEARTACSETQHQQLVAKYQERFEFDPLEAKRAAMAVKTMQNTLQSVMLDKEELGIRYGDLKEQYRKFHGEQLEIVESLKKQVAALEQRRVRERQQRVVNALAQWSTNYVQTAWHKWVALTKDKRRQEQSDKMIARVERKVDERVVKLQANQAAVLAMKLLQQAARRTFVRWRDSTRESVERRRKGRYFAEQRARKSVQRVMNYWRVKCQKASACRSGSLKIARVVACHSRRWGMQRWRVETFRLALAEKDRKLETLRSSAELQAKTIVDLESALEDVRDASRAMRSRYEEEKAAFTANVEAHRATELTIRQKLGRFFTKQCDRQLLKEFLREWRTTAKYLKGREQRSSLAQSKLRILKLRRSVFNWHCTARQSRKKQQILGRMRQLEVFKCFNSWKERVHVEKTRKTALLHAVNRIRNRGVARCFTQWTAFRSERISLRRGLEVLTKYALKQQVYFLYSLWRERVTQWKIETQIRQQQLIQQAWEVRLAQTKRDLNFQRECVTRWHEVVVHKQRRQTIAKKCVARLKNGSLARVLGSWRDFVDCSKAQRDLVRRWIDHCRTSLLKHAWSRWQRQIVLKEQQLLIARLQRERDAELKQVEAEFDAYRKTQQTLLEKAEKLQTQQARQLQDTASRLEEESKRAQRLTGAVKTLCSTRERSSTQLRHFKAWQNVVRRKVGNRRAVQPFQITLDTRQTRCVLGEWRQVAVQQIRLRAVFKTLHSCHAEWWRIQCFQAWNEARRRSRAVKVFSALFARNSDVFMCREVFSEWRNLARKNHLLRRTLEQIWLGSVHARMRQQFTHWVAFTKAEAAKEQLVQRNVALTAIQAKVWWKRSLSRMRLCFSEWKFMVQSKKKQRQGERKLLQFQQSRLVTVCFSEWADFVMVKRREEDRNQRFARWLWKVARRKQQRAMSLWKMRIIRNQIRDLHELKDLQTTQQERLQLQREEILSLVQTSTDTKRKLADAMDVHDASTTKVQYVTECGLLAKSFNALKLKVSIRRYQRQAVYFSQKSARRRCLAELFSNWYSFSQNCRVLKSIVDQKAKRCEDILTRTVLRQWHATARLNRVVQQKQHKLQQRVRLRTIKTNFAEWQRLIHRERRIITAMDTLELLAQRLTLRSTLSLWHQKCLQERHRVLQEREKHWKIMQFLMGRQEAGLMRAFLSRCYANSIRNNATRHRRVIEEMKRSSDAALAKVKEHSEARAKEEMGALSAVEEQLTAGASFQALQTLIRRLFQPTTVKDLFVSVGSTFAQILHGSAAVLFLFDPSSNELWTQREENQLIQVPASLGIAGSTLSSGSTMVITDVSSDPRFHPMVDQFVLSSLRQDDTSTLMMATRPNAHAVKPTVGMVSTPLTSPDGAAYGVLQVAFSTSSLSSVDRRVLITQTQLYSKTCCFYVEQLVFEMLRNCRDRVRARSPEKFMTLFKQNKNWRKYYAAMERKAVDLEGKLREVLDEREQLIQVRSELQKRHQKLQDKLESGERNTKDVSKLVADWKKKLVKWQKVLDEKDRAIAEKTNELETMKNEFGRYRRERRSKDLQNVLNSSRTGAKRSSSSSSAFEDSDDSTGKSPSFSDRGQLSILKADQTRLQSQLVRAEADNLLLVKAISIARTQHGELPKTIQAEVTRVATRVSRRAPAEA
ncbi:hypothetical protein PF004_g2836 [Phytophthora fragariae]|uniref:GAF domain-containing protein n=2 Tax=Phytophthora fragariae TaxID=53985 RepID=A0A6G0PNR7_9STRA|nr:hypothetical protein PF004_g2836 [Phytophthora fragariae]